eukprot:TRINITY_DN17275_c0_g1_i1.p1 TRINITY_DN17275_c0_g1~~TRINITY_DN17275_c0_g1_i1.p1  ORF type:complete len:849 (-),score=131.50 TRINITY_DN17275_c0_g1_i1:61-2607(-)
MDKGNSTPSKLNRVDSMDLNKLLSDDDLSGSSEMLVSGAQPHLSAVIKELRDLRSDVAGVAARVGQDMKRELDDLRAMLDRRLTTGSSLKPGIYVPHSGSAVASIPGGGVSGGAVPDRAESTSASKAATGHRRCRRSSTMSPGRPGDAVDDDSIQKMISSMREQQRSARVLRSNRAKQMLSADSMDSARKMVSDSSHRGENTSRVVSPDLDSDASRSKSRSNTMPALERAVTPVVAACLPGFTCRSDPSEFAPVVPAAAGDEATQSRTAKPLTADERSVSKTSLKQVTEPAPDNEDPPKLKPMEFEEDDYLDTSTFIGKLTVFVCSAHFDVGSGLLVLLNAITIGLQTNVMAQGVMVETPFEYRVIEMFFCFIFTCEILCRVAVYRMLFLIGPGFLWNLFDMVLVGMQLTEELLSTLLSMSSIGFNFSFMRVLRILRLVRIIRIVRLLRLIRELRTIVSSIAGSMKSLGWTVLLLFLIIYVLGVCLTQVVLDYRVEAADPYDPTDEDNIGLEQYYGDLMRSLVSLYQSVSGGVDWENILQPLLNKIGPIPGILLILFVMFTSLALLNVVTGVFVESALQSAKNDQDTYMLNHMRKLFKMADKEGKGMITWEAFDGELSNPSMLEFFQSIDVDPSEARGVFHLLDVDESGTIELEEFLNGCLGLHGPAKALDLATLMWETRQMNRLFTAHAFTVDKSLHGIINVLPGAAAAVSESSSRHRASQLGSGHMRSSRHSAASFLGEAPNGEGEDESSPRWGNRLFRKGAPTSQTTCTCGAVVPADVPRCKSCGRAAEGSAGSRAIGRRSSAPNGNSNRRQSLTSLAMADPRSANIPPRRPSSTSRRRSGSVSQ